MLAWPISKRGWAAFQSGWGLEGIPPILEVAVGSKVYSLGQIADEYLEKRIARSGLLSYGAEAVRACQ